MVTASRNNEVFDLSEHARCTLANFNQSAQLASLNNAVALHRETIFLRPRQHCQRLVSMGGLAATLYARFLRTDDLLDLDEAISLLCEAVEACPEAHVYWVGLLDNLSVALTARFDKTGQLMEEAMERRRDALVGISIGFWLVPR
jgi:hypothetical protein